MFDERKRIVGSWPLFCGTATVTFALSSASVALAIVDLVNLNLKVRSWGAISTTAATMGCFALLFIVILTVCRLGCSGAWFHRWVLPWTGALVTVIAAIFSINALVLKAINYDEVKRSKAVRMDVTAQFALWGVAVVLQVLFYSFVMLRQIPWHSKSSLSDRREKKSAPRRPPSPRTPLQIATRPLSSTTASASLSPSVKLNVEAKRSSWRDSLVSLRPNNSRTKLLSSHATLSRDSSIRSAATTRSDGFDSWDTSHVDLGLREAISPAVPKTGRTLETIPGSRPASPATTLDGRFPSTEDIDTMSFPQLVERPPTAHSQLSVSHQRIKWKFIPASCPLSSSDAGGDESHIHPLFRTDSPTPPPAISRDTILTASPMGGQVMPAPVRPACRMRSASQLSTSAPLFGGLRSPSRASSMDELPAAARRARSIDERRLPNNSLVSSALHQPPGPLPFTAIASDVSHQHTVELCNNKTRSPSPISRGRTPPIPEFILSAKLEGPKSKSSKETLK